LLKNIIQKGDPLDLSVSIIDSTGQPKDINGGVADEFLDAKNKLKTKKNEIKRQGN
jgi:hypothetical protein